MSITSVILDLICESLGCKENPCPYVKDKTQCPKQIECNYLCELMCPDREEDE